MTHAASFGRWLSARRHLLDLTQDELARQVGCSVVTIRKLEADERRPSKQIAERLANSLGIAERERAAFLTFARSEASADMAEVPLPASTHRPGRPLPTSLTPLIGRDQDLAAVRNHLMRSETRLLTLVGAPGIGKTRLASAIAGDVQPAFADGAVFVALAPISDPDLVLGTIAQTLGVKEVGDQPLLEVLQTHLRDRHQLLILDNFEQVLAAALAIAELLVACPHLKVLATSRAALHIRGEQLYPVPSLLLPDLAQLPSVSALAHIPAITLFVERAQAVLPSFQLTDANAAMVAAICARLDGLPLAIELVAARVRLLPPSALLSRLADRLALLTDGPRDLPPRQQTLRGAITWSYDLLDDGAKWLFRQLGVFVGGCTVAAVEAVCNPAGGLPFDVLAGLAVLLDHSLLQQVEGSDGEPRFTMLETIREYALEQLTAIGELNDVQKYHARYYLTLAEMAEPGLQSAQQAAALNQLDTEYDNLRLALAWSLGSGGDVSIGVQLAGALGNYWNIRGHMSEGRRWLEGALATSRLRPDPGARAKALNWAAVLAWQQNDYTQTRILAEESLAQFRELGDKRGIATALFSLGIVAFRYAEHAHAVALLEEDLALSQEIGDKRLRCSALSVLGNVARAQGDLARAAVLHQQCLELAYELKEPQNLAYRLNAFGETMHYQGDNAQAAVLFEQSFALACEHGEKPSMAVALYGLGLVTHAQHDHAQARVRFLESLSLRREIGDRNGIAQCLEGLGAVAVAQEQPERTIRLCASAEGLRRAIGTRLNVVQRPLYERTLAAARAQINEAAFAAAWEEGWAMPLEQVIAYALDGSM